VQVFSQLARWFVGWLITTDNYECACNICLFTARVLEWTDVVVTRPLNVEQPKICLCGNLTKYKKMHQQELGSNIGLALNIFCTLEQLVVLETARVWTGSCAVIEVERTWRNCQAGTEIITALDRDDGGCGGGGGDIVHN
jgi:hypothetical protein